ncbi:hypothetical protein SORBI_3007G100425 [Sorghum bicolor]|uniref:Uncharacterized protein n=1 Tax=Sorghum bicolor TaxID=4558 RepID=A0A1Z5R9Y9_SORBI|nr:hypothetical protein SORBI_3007G100425 [Sorghum bicolor]
MIQAPNKHFSKWYHLSSCCQIAASLGAKHQSHQDYMEKANKARSERLSSGQPSALKE